MVLMQTVFCQKLLVGCDKASVTSDKLPIVEETTMSIQVITYIINKVCFNAMFSFAVTVGNISILNSIYDLGFKLHAMTHILKVLQLIKSPKCVLCITIKILLIACRNNNDIYINFIVNDKNIRCYWFFAFKTDGIGLG